MAQVKNLEQRDASVWVSIEPWGEFKKEEAYLRFTGEWLGVEVKFTVLANRYATADGTVTNWRTWVSDGAPSDAARARMREQTAERVTEWLSSDEYKAQRRDAYRHAIKRIIADERYNPDKVADVLFKYSAELDAPTVERLGRAIEHLRGFLRELSD